MNKQTGLSTVALASFLVMLASCQQEAVEPPSDMVAEAQAISGQFVGTLLPTLQAAMQAGGPVRGIEVCSVAAPQIAADLSRDSGWDVSRVSLKARNQETAIPDDWETQVLQDFDRRQQAGEAAGQINQAAVVNGELRYMQAQPAGELCLTCHGTDISSDVRAALNEHYPGDAATGYMAGQIRGAISIRRSL
ncbi:Tll0287-like domain-containing protein [Pseudohongiella spirulinae]|uniref:Cytochrome C n=1 Tax=Pseudohongiella spirulinae TaxID=1249552 RepID=A0A0S2KAP2_9GAMM|nr:DUF3365 domain-containing protein [Pseudohongiella spirulinae]ALO45042.1 cytochrome C [Pseudohongiella spirulinae]